MHGRILDKDCGCQMIEALNQPSAREGLRDIRMRFETDSQKDDVRRREKGGHRSYLRRIGHALERIERGEELHTLLA